MGQTPIVWRVSPTPPRSSEAIQDDLVALNRREYVEGRLTVEEFEARVGTILATTYEEHSTPPPPRPPRPTPKGYA